MAKSHKQLEDEVRMAQRQKQVAALFLRRFTQVQIADALHVDQATISRDLQAVVKQAREEATSNLLSRRDREEMELDQMEQDAALRFNLTKKESWLQTRLQIKKRRAEMLGLDAAGKSVNLDIDWANLSEDQLKRIRDGEDPLAVISGTRPG